MLLSHCFPVAMKLPWEFTERKTVENQIPPRANYLGSQDRRNENVSLRQGLSLVLPGIPGTVHNTHRAPCVVTLPISAAKAWQTGLHCLKTCHGSLGLLKAVPGQGWPRRAGSSPEEPEWKLGSLKMGHNLS